MSDKKPLAMTRKGILSLLEACYSIDSGSEFLILDNALHVRFRTVQDEPKGSGIHVCPSTKADVLDAVTRALNACHENVYFYLPAPVFNNSLTERIFYAMQNHAHQKQTLQDWAGRESLPVSSVAIRTLRGHCDNANAYAHLFPYLADTADWERIIRSLKAQSPELLKPVPFEGKTVADAWRERA